jgi:hypothetical protein
VRSSQFTSLSSNACGIMVSICRYQGEHPQVIESIKVRINGITMRFVAPPRIGLELIQMTVPRLSRELRARATACFSAETNMGYKGETLRHFFISKINLSNEFILL